MSAAKKDVPAASPNTAGKQYITLKHEAHIEFEERKSIFLGHAKSVKTEEDAAAFVNSMKREYSDASHNVSAYQILSGAVARYSDDGEPHGTAGAPVLNVIKQSGAEDIVVVVTRYFGGILLGAGGLVRAYSATAKLALDAAEISVLDEYICLSFSCSYSEYQKIQNELPKFGAAVEDADFADSVNVKTAVKEAVLSDFRARISDITNGAAEIIEYDRKFA